MGEGRGIYSVAMFHVAASLLAATIFYAYNEKTSSARSLAYSLQIEVT